MPSNIDSQPAAQLTRQQQKAHTRIRILEAARGCFADLGWARTNIAAISEAAGVAHGTFYVHFPSKEAILDELLQRFNESLVQRLGPVFANAPAAPLSQTVRLSAEIFLDYWQGQRGFVRAYAEFGVGNLRLASMRDGVNPPMAQQLSRTLAAAAKARGAPAVNWDLVTQALLSMWLRVGLQYLFNDAVSRDEAIDVLVTLSLGATAALLPDA